MNASHSEDPLTPTAAATGRAVANRRGGSVPGVRAHQPGPPLLRRAPALEERECHRCPAVCCSSAWSPYPAPPRLGPSHRHDRRRRHARQVRRPRPERLQRPGRHRCRQCVSNACATLHYRALGVSPKKKPQERGFS